MEQIQDSDYILYKALSDSILQGLAKPLKKLETVIDAQVLKYEKLRAKFLACETYDELGMNSKKLEELKAELIRLCSVHDRLEMIVKRNEQRLGYYKTKLDAFGIYNYQVDKSLFSSALKNEEDNISEESLNLNPYVNGVTFKFFANKILAFKNEMLDFSLIENEEVLKTANSEFFHELVETFPYSVATIPDEFYLVSNIKNNILKECVLFVASKMKKQTIAESNKELGGILSNAGSLSSILEYANEMKNYLNVSVKKCFKDNEPDLADDIDKNLKCNEASEFLPSSKRVAVLANGLAGDVPKTEAELSEEVRKAQEEEAQSSITREELLELLLADDEEEIEEVQELKETEKKAEDERNLNEKQEDELELDELERELELALKKNDVVED